MDTFSHIAKQDPRMVLRGDRQFRAQEGKVFAAALAHGWIRWLCVMAFLGTAIILRAQAPNITVQPSGVLATVGTDVTLNVEALGSEPLAYQWKRNGLNLAEATESTLVIPSAKPSHSGFYSVRVFNEFGADLSATVPVRVVKPPVFDLQPASTNVAEGEPLFLAARAFGTDPISYQWFREGLPLADYTGPILTTNAARIQQSGHYQVVAFNDGGSITSAVAVVAVLQPPFIVTQPVSRQVMLGESTNFQVTAVGSAPLRYQWRHNGQVVPGATNATLMILQTHTGALGNYQVMVGNDLGGIRSEIATLTTELTTLNGADFYSNRVALAGAQGIVEGANVNATSDSMDPMIAGKRGGASVWYEWTAPESGIATFRTTGSHFDTLLGVLFKPMMANLQVIAEDDDSGPFHTDIVKFNVQAGSRYPILVDGVAGRKGRFVLNWDLEVTPERLPIITRHPRRRTVPFGAEVAFRVEAMGVGLDYEWYFNGELLPGVQSDTLVVNQASRDRVGRYQVRVRNMEGRAVRSRPATLEIGPFPEVFSVDKLAERRPGLFAPLPLSNLTEERSMSATPSVSSGTGFISVSAGSLFSFVFSGVGATTDETEDNCCGRIPRLYVSTDVSDFTISTNVAPAQDGILVFNLDEMNDDAVIQVLDIDGNCLACSATGELRMSATAGTEYLPVISLLEETKDPIGLSVRFDLAISNAIPTMELDAKAGEDLTLAVDAVDARTGGSLADVGYQWYLDGFALEEGVTEELFLPSLSWDDAGTYTVVLTNLVSRKEVTAAVVDVQEQPQLTLEWFGAEQGASVLVTAGPVTGAMRLEESADAETWGEVSTAETSDGRHSFLSYEKADLTNAPVSLYRLKDTTE